MVKSYEDISSG